MKRQKFNYEGQQILIANRVTGGIGLWSDGRFLGEMERTKSGYRFTPKNGAELVDIKATSFHAAAVSILGGAVL